MKQVSVQFLTCWYFIVLHCVLVHSGHLKNIVTGLTSDERIAQWAFLVSIMCEL